MPCIQIKTNVKVDEATAELIKAELGQAITCLPEKTEDWLMVCLEDDCRMWFRGDSSKPVAIVEVKVFGNAIDKDAATAMTKQVCPLFSRTLGIDAADMYIRYLASPDWGWNNDNF